MIIGNSDYKSVGHPDNPKNDALLIAKTLRELGFNLVGIGRSSNLASTQRTPLPTPRDESVPSLVAGPYRKPAPDCRLKHQRFQELKASALARGF